MNNNYTQKKELLRKHMAEYMAEDAIVAFSGGVDSSLLLKLACDASRVTG